jgi:hypothetical protein
MTEWKTIDKSPLIQVRLGDLSKHCNWDLVCKELGLNYYCMNEGANPDDFYTITTNQAKRIGLFKEGE